MIRDRNQLYRERASLIENVYTLKVLNLADRSREFHIAASGIAGLELAGANASVSVPAGGVLDVPVILRAHEHALAAVSRPPTTRHCSSATTPNSWGQDHDQ